MRVGGRYHLRRRGCAVSATLSAGCPWRSSPNDPHCLHRCEGAPEPHTNSLPPREPATHRLALQHSGIVAVASPRENAAKCAGNGTPSDGLLTDLGCSCFKCAGAAHPHRCPAAKCSCARLRTEPEGRLGRGVLRTRSWLGWTPHPLEGAPEPRHGLGRQPGLPCARPGSRIGGPGKPGARCERRERLGDDPATAGELPPRMLEVDGQVAQRHAPPRIHPA